MCILLVSGLLPATSWGLASNNIPLDSPIYLYMEKLSGFGLIDTDVHGLKPFSKSEAARLVMEAENNIKETGPECPELAHEIIRRIRELIPREADLWPQEDEAPAFDVNPLSSYRFRYVYLDGTPRSFNRKVADPGGEGVFGIGRVRPKNQEGDFVTSNGSEGTPLLENNDGIVYQDHNNYEARLDIEGYAGNYASVLLEPLVISRPGERQGSSYIGLSLNKGYVKFGGHGLELEVGRDENWFGQGYRGTTTLTNNAGNLDMVKLSSPEPVEWPWLRENIGILKYAVVFSRLDESGSGSLLRQPWFAAFNLEVKPTDNLEIGMNMGRQTGGPNVQVGGGITGVLFGGEEDDGSNFVGGYDFRWRIPWLGCSTVYFEFAGEDNAAVWPTIESYVAGIYIPRLTPDGKNDLRFEFYLGSRIEYTNGVFWEGYTNDGLLIGDSRGGDTKEYFTRFTHFFSARNRLALEYFHTQRGTLGRIDGQAVEDADAGRVFWSLPVASDWDLLLNYGYENIRNFNLVQGDGQEDHLFRMDLCYRY